MSKNTPPSWSFKFEPFINYESILCTFFPGSPQKINAACMGVHFTSNDEVYIHAYEDTHTRKLLTPGAQFSINFSENFYEYVVAALRRKDREEFIDELPREAFNRLEPAPILQSSWLWVICEVLPMPEHLFQQPFCRRRETPNIRGKILDLRLQRPPKIFNNRSWNFALEALILATRIPLYDQYSTEYTKGVDLYKFYKQKITEWHDMTRFESAFEVIDNFLLNSKVKAGDLFSFPPD